MDAVPTDWLRAVYDEWGRGNFRAGGDRLAPDFEFSTGPDFPDPVRGVASGEAVRDYWRGFLSSWAHLRIEALEMTPAGDRALIVVRQTGTGRASGVETSLEYFHVWRFGEAGATRLDVLLGAGEAHAEHLRGLYDRWARGDFDAGADLFAPDVDFITSEGFPDAPAPGSNLDRVARWRDESSRASRSCGSRRSRSSRSASACSCACASADAFARPGSTSTSPTSSCGPSAAHGRCASRCSSRARR